MRFVGHQNNRINLVSHKESPNLTKLPESLNHLSDEQLILECRIVDGQIVHKGPKPAQDLKIALVGNYKQRCGISTYAEKLWEKVIPLVNDAKLFIEYNETPTSNLLELGNIKLEYDQVVQCWERGKSLSNLVEEIKKFNPDIIWIQHEFGLWSHAGYWLSMLTQLNDFRVIVTMHSTFHHQDKTIVEAAIPEIVVHLEGARRVLIDEKKINRPVSIIPHGADLPHSEGKLWNFYKTPHTIVQFGFLFKYKGWEQSLRSIALLKEKYPDVFFTGLCSENQFGRIEHEVYYHQLLDLVKNLGIQENVSLIRGFQSDQVIDSYLRTNQIALFPYISIPGHEVFGASGAARSAMEKEIPVVSSSIPHFSDLPTIKANNEHEIAHEIGKLFDNWKLKRKQIEVQNEFLKTISWEIIARKYVDLFENR